MRPVERWMVAVTVLIGLTVVASFPVVAQQPRAGTPAQSQVERGRYLVTVQDCNGCHTPFTAKGEPDMTRMLSGHPQNVQVAASPSLPLQGGWIVAINETNTAWAGPWGVSFTSNLTPNRATGIGAWNEQLLHRVDPKRQEVRYRPGTAAANALAHVREALRRRPQGHLRVPQHDSRDRQSRP